MSGTDFEELINGYRKKAYIQAVEDFIDGFAACEFHCDEFFFALADIFKAREFDEIASRLQSLGESVPLNSEGIASFWATHYSNEKTTNS